MRVLIAFSDTGGGHRAAARSLQAALARTAPHAVVQLVDPYAMTDRWPFSRLHTAYPAVAGRAPWLWQFGFRVTNSGLVTATLQAAAWPLLRPAFRRLRREGTPDVIVSTHPLLTSPLRQIFPDVPIIVVVTDLVTGHRSWYDRAADLIVVPTAAALQQAVASGVDHQRLIELGAPIDPSFAAAPESYRAAERARLVADLGWSDDRPTLLMMGGGDGIGPLEALAEAIDAAPFSADLAIIAGRNAGLARRLRERNWRRRVHVYDFVPNVAAMMQAASALITKAGPGTICEAFAAACPLILYGAIPGQETGNVQLVCESGSGVWAHTPAAVAEALARWFADADAEQRRARAAAAARAAARPAAADQIVQRVLELAADRDRTTVAAILSPHVRSTRTPYGNGRGSAGLPVVAEP